MAPWDWGFLLAGVALYVMVLSTMLRDAYSRYPFVFAYVIQQFLSTVTLFSLIQYFGSKSKEYSRAYWANDFLSTALALLIIIHLIRAAMDGHRYRNPVYRGLLLGALATGLVSLQLMSSHARSLSHWMHEVSRDYYFGAVLLNTILWFILVRRSHEDKQLYLMTSGLGLQLTGAAIAFALRVDGQIAWLSRYLVQITYLTNLYVWYICLKEFPAVAPARTDPIPETPTLER